MNGTQRITNFLSGMIVSLENANDARSIWQLNIVEKLNVCRGVFTYFLIPIESEGGMAGVLYQRQAGEC